MEFAFLLVNVPMAEMKNYSQKLCMANALSDRIFSVSILIGNKKLCTVYRSTLFQITRQYFQITEKMSSNTNHSLFIDPRIGLETLAKICFRSIRNKASFICAHL